MMTGMGTPNSHSKIPLPITSPDFVGDGLVSSLVRLAVIRYNRADL